MTRPIAYVGDHVALTTTVFGKKIYVDTEDVVCSPHVLLDGMWESWVGKFMEPLVTKGQCFVDVGANIGWYTLLACDWVGEKGSVIAYEPNANLVDLLNRTLSVNGYLDRCQVMACALSDGDSRTADLSVPHLHGGNGHLDGEGHATQSVIVKSLDSVVPPGRTVDFIKIDAEGSEAAILRGAKGVIADNPRIRLLVEHHGPEHREGRALDEEMQILRHLTGDGGFRLGLLEHDSSLTAVSIERLGEIPDSEMLFLERPR